MSNDSHAKRLAGAMTLDDLDAEAKEAIEAALKRGPVDIRYPTSTMFGFDAEQAGSEEALKRAREMADLLFPEEDDPLNQNALERAWHEKQMPPELTADLEEFESGFDKAMVRFWEWNGWHFGHIQIPENLPEEKHETYVELVRNVARSAMTTASRWSNLSEALHNEQDSWAALAMEAVSDTNASLLASALFGMLPLLPLYMKMFYTAAHGSFLTGRPAKPHHIQGHAHEFDETLSIGQAMLLAFTARRAEEEIAELLNEHGELPEDLVEEMRKHGINVGTVQETGDIVGEAERVREVRAQQSRNPFGPDDGPAEA